MAARRRSSIRRVGDDLKLDVGRFRRTGIPELVLAEGKTDGQVSAAALTLAKATGRAIVTRILRPIRWTGIEGYELEEHFEARLAILRRPDSTVRPTGGRVAILSAGATDRPIAAEAEIVARELGCEVRTERDVGVASLERALDALNRHHAWDPHVYIVVAGREAALAPVTAGLVHAPVIGVPVASGYGRGGKGEAALLTMLQSCAPLVTVNIDAGVVAGCVAAQIANQAARRKKA